MSIEAWVIPAILTFLCNGVITFLPKTILRSLGVLDMLVYNSFFLLLGAVGVQIYYGVFEFDTYGVIIALITGIVGTMGQLLYLVAIKNGPVTYVSMLSSLYPLVATILALSFLENQDVSPRQWCGIALGICSILLLVKGQARGQKT